MAAKIIHKYKKNHRKKEQFNKAIHDDDLFDKV